jgi:hypothetical protein
MPLSCAINGTKRFHLPGIVAIGFPDKCWRHFGAISSSDENSVLQQWRNGRIAEQKIVAVRPVH